MSNASRTSIGFLGGGNMGRALIAALRRQGVAAENIFVAEPQQGLRTALAQQLEVRAVADAASFIEQIDVLVLAVKPQDMAEIIKPLRSAIATRKPLVISIAAGLSTTQLARLCGAGVPIVRAMPNRPALLAAGATGLFAGSEVTTSDRLVAENLLAAAGMVIWVADESLMDVVTALSGSGPAYFFRLAEALAAAAIAQGLEPEAARRLAAATLHGAGQMAAAPADLAQLRESVTSKGGTTAAALATFDTLQFETMVAAAMQAAAQRGRELAAQLDAQGD